VMIIESRLRYHVDKRVVSEFNIFSLKEELYKEIYCTYLTPQKDSNRCSIMVAITDHKQGKINLDYVQLLQH